LTEAVVRDDARGFYHMAIAVTWYRQVAGFVGKMVRKKNATGGTSRWMNALSNEKDAMFCNGLSLAHRLLTCLQKSFRAHASGVTAVPTDASL
jgi:hypothetical protein